MPRAKIDLGDKWEKAFLSKLAPAVLERVRSEPQTERELAAFAIQSAGTKEMSAQLKRLYSMQFQKHLSESTARRTIERAAIRAISAVKAALPPEIRRSRERIQIGKGEKHGALLYADERAAKSKLSKLYLSAKSKSLGKDALLLLSKRNYLPLESLNYPRKQVESSLASLLEFGVIEERVSSRGPYFVLPERPVDSQEAAAKGDRKLLLKAESEFKGLSIYEGFRTTKWLLGAQGPMERKIVFSFAAFQPEGRQLHLCHVSEKQASLAILRELREKAAELALPASLHMFAPSFSKEAEDYAAKSGIMTHTLSREEALKTAGRS